MTAPAQTPRLELTREALALSLRIKVGAKGYLLTGLGALSGGPTGDTSAEAIADAIRLHGLSEALTGLRHDGKPVKFNRAFELIYGERLTLR